MTQTPTEAVDYAILSSAYGALLGAAALSAREREPVSHAELPILAAATFALSKLIVHEKVESWIRQPFVDERADRRDRARLLGRQRHAARRVPVAVRRRQYPGARGE